MNRSWAWWDVHDISLVKKTIATKGLTAAQAAAMSEAQWMQLFTDGRRNVSGSFDQPDFALTLKSMKSNKHFTLQQAGRMYVGLPSGQGKKYGYSRYCQLFTEFVATHDVVATLHHEPGRAMLVDWAGDTLPVTDAVTGEIRKAYLFVAVLPFSGLVFCRAFGDMKQDAWISAHVQAFEFAGGATQIIVPDNATGNRAQPPPLRQRTPAGLATPPSARPVPGLRNSSTNYVDYPYHLVLSAINAISRNYRLMKT